MTDNIDDMAETIHSFLMATAEGPAECMTVLTYVMYNIDKEYRAEGKTLDDIIGMLREGFEKYAADDAQQEAKNATSN